MGSMTNTPNATHEEIGETAIPLPEGYTYLGGNLESGVVVKDKCYNQFVWVPVNDLPTNGTLNGRNFDQKFGRRCFNDRTFTQCTEKISTELQRQIESVERYGGFYISRFAISQSRNGSPKSLQGRWPWTNIDYHQAVEQSKKFGCGETTSHLIYGAEFDTTICWLENSGSFTKEQIEITSLERGNYVFDKEVENEILKTGVYAEFYANNIADLAGNCCEWTQEKFKDPNFYVLRGGSYLDDGHITPVSIRTAAWQHQRNERTGFRLALCIK